MLEKHISSCVHLHYCASITIDKDLWEKHKKKYKKEEGKILDVLEIDQDISFLCYFNLNKIKGKKNKYHFYVNFINTKQNNKNILENKKFQKSFKDAKIQEQNISKLNIAEQKIRTQKQIDCHNGHIKCTYKFNNKQFYSTIGIPFAAPPNILDIGDATIGALGFEFKNSRLGLKRVFIAKEDKYFAFNFQLNKDIRLDENFLHNLFNSTTEVSSLFIKEIE